MAAKKKAPKKKAGAELVTEALTTWAKLNEHLRELSVPQLQDAIIAEKNGKNRKDVVFRLVRRMQTLQRIEQRKALLSA